MRGIKGEPVGIGRLERFVADWHTQALRREAPKAPEANGHKVAVIGAGPAGLTCAGDLARMGYKVTVFEALHIAGGVLMLRHPGVPSAQGDRAEGSRQPEGAGRGHRDRYGHRQGALRSTSCLRTGYEAVFIGSGAGLPRFMDIPGESLQGSVFRQ